MHHPDYGTFGQLPGMMDPRKGQIFDMNLPVVVDQQKYTVKEDLDQFGLDKSSFDDFAANQHQPDRKTLGSIKHQPANPCKKEDLMGHYFKGRQPIKLESQIFNNLPYVSEDLLKDRLEMNSSQVKIKNNQIEKALMLEAVGEHQLDTGQDLSGDKRNWQNWVIPTFQPFGASTIGGPGFGGHHPQIINLVSSPPEFNPNDTSEKVSQKFDFIRNQCKAEREAFRDPEFPADEKSIFGFFPERIQKKRNVKDSVWMRPAQYFRGKGYTMWDKTIDPSDVKQGELGDCYFLVALSSLAQFPDRLKKIIRFRRASDVGAYCFYFCLHGVWEEIIVDDKVPCHEKSYEPIFCRSLTRELWPGLLEKAWAKVHGGYFNIEAGTLEEAMHSLTGAPTIHYVVKNGEVNLNKWEKLHRGHYLKYAMACSTQDFNGRTITDKGACAITGLIRSHAYSILGIYEVSFQEGRKPRLVAPGSINHKGSLRLLKLRNPWNKYEWFGAWSDKDSRWTPELRILLGATTHEGGIFFITYEDFVNNFANFVICQVNDKFKFSGTKFATSSENPTILSFKLNTPGSYSFSLSQISKRFFRASDQYQYSACTLLIARLDSQGKFNYIGSGHEQHQHVFVEAECQPGYYIAYICTPWRRKVNEIGFTIYGPEQVPSVRIVNEQEIPSDFVIKLFLDKALKNPQLAKSFQGSKNLSTIRYINDISSSGLGYIFFENKSDDIQMTAFLKFSDCSNTVFYPPLIENHHEVVVAPNKMKIIVFRMTNPQSHFYYSQSVIFESNCSKHIAHLKKHGQQQKRPWGGKDVGITLFMLKFDNAILYCYENNSKNFEIRELLEFRLTNCELASKATSLYSHVRPGGIRMASITAIDPRKPFDAEILDCRYSVTEVQQKHLNSFLVQ